MSEERKRTAELQKREMNESKERERQKHAKMRRKIANEAYELWLRMKV